MPNFIGAILGYLLATFVFIFIVNMPLQERYNEASLRLCEIGVEDNIVSKSSEELKNISIPQLVEQSLWKGLEREIIPSENVREACTAIAERMLKDVNFSR